MGFGIEAIVAAGLVFVSGVIGFALIGLLLSLLHQKRRQKRVVSRLSGGAVGGEVAGKGAVVLIEEEARDFLSRQMKNFSIGRRISRVLETGGSDISVGAFVVRALVVGVILGALAGLAMRSPIAAAVGFIVGLWVVWTLAGRKAKKRLARFEEGFPDAIDLLARALLAGHPFSAGIRMVADETIDPIQSEFRLLFEEQKYGMPVKDSLERFADRVGLLDTHIFVTAVLVQREVGGDLAEILGNISTTIRERFVIKRQVSTYTAQGRMTGYMLGAMPLVMGLVIWLMNPENMSLFFTDPRGKMLLGGALGMQATGLLIIRKIIDIDI